jgi:hypothetical protein
MKSECVTINLTAKSRCQGECLANVRQALQKIGVTSTVVSEIYPTVSKAFPSDDSPCVGFRSDIGGTEAGAKALATFLGHAYSVVASGRSSICTAAGYSYNLFLE